MPSILFICTANRFRSPLASAIFCHLLSKAGLENQWKVSSAGTWTEEGMPATREAIEWAQKTGLDLAGHRSRGINQEIVSAADLVVVMEQGHKEALNNEFTGIDEKIFTLTELAGKPVFDIPDPYSNIDELPEAVANEIQQLLLKAFDRIILWQGRSLS